MAVVGQVGAGKSSLVPEALLGEMKKLRGTVALSPGKCAYMYYY